MWWILHHLKTGMLEKRVENREAMTFDRKEAMCTLQTITSVLFKPVKHSVCVLVLEPHVLT